MYAVIQTGGKQYKVSQGDIIDVEKIPIPQSKEVRFDEVLLCADKKECTIGQPFIKGAHVTADIIDEIRGKKITTYKYKRRKNYHRTIGHRQDLVRLRIKEIEIKKEQ